MIIIILTLTDDMALLLSSSIIIMIIKFCLYCAHVSFWTSCCLAHIIPLLSTAGSRMQPNIKTLPQRQRLGLLAITHTVKKTTTFYEKNTCTQYISSPSGIHRIGMNFVCLDEKSTGCLFKWRNRVQWIGCEEESGDCVAWCIYAFSNGIVQFYPLTLSVCSKFLCDPVEEVNSPFFNHSRGRPSPHSHGSKATVLSPTVRVEGECDVQ